ncbi:beta-lactamase family protein [Sphingomonas sabuli]|uniref:Beta-lactamase family protein n=1 Tax=Sphingomonas sabuli TaxID=2764186 RepID=A0A7G9L3F6_9SPHN|nr:serine hydrolase domain-containing protein [Sphingomonas sabuli]QNM83155.1 beta-lactamase family protein [Sphingomonas sabuli]
MKAAYRFAIVVIAAAIAIALFAIRPHSDESQAADAGNARAQLAAVSPAARHDVDYALLDARLAKLMERPTMVGLAVGVVENGRITFLKGYGETLAGSGEPVTPETVFRWASVSKGVAATMVTKLAEEGKVELDAPIATYRTTLRLPDGAEHRATVADLLSHRLGIYHNAYDERLESGEDPKLIRQQHATLSLVCQPGTCWNYENVAYDAASEIVEHETGETYQDALARTLFSPLGMDSASATREGIMSAKSWARPHSVGRREVELNDAYYRVPAAGGVNSDIKDLAVWMLAQMGRMPGVISPNVINAMHASIVKTPGERSRLRNFRERLNTAWYGFGWRSYDYAGHHLIGHRGGVNGYRSLILFDPKKKSGVVALWNSNTSQPGGLEFEVMDMVYKLPFRDWLQVDTGSAPGPTPVTEEVNSGNGTAG